MSSSFIICNNSEPFLDWILTCDKKWILYNQQQPTQWLDSEEAPKHFPKPKLPPKKIHGHCLVFSCWFDPLQLSESQCSHDIWEVCSAAWWDALKTAVPAASIGQQKGPSSSLWQCLTALGTTSDSKVEWIGLQSFASSAIFTRPLTNWLPLLPASWQLFCRENAFTTIRMQKILSKCYFQESRSTDFYATGNKFISSWQKYIDCNPIFLFSINKDVFEANYNDLKFRVWNHNYFCTNLIENKLTDIENRLVGEVREGRAGINTF